jgi:hypothetical protein
MVLGDGIRRNIKTVGLLGLRNDGSCLEGRRIMKIALTVYQLGAPARLVQPKEVWRP